MGILNSMRILYKTSLLTESYALLKSIKRWCTASLCYHFFSSICRMQNIWSVVDLLHRNPHWWSPIISSAYGINLDSRMSDKILYVVMKATFQVNIWIRSHSLHSNSTKCHGVCYVHSETGEPLGTPVTKVFCCGEYTYWHTEQYISLATSRIRTDGLFNPD
jgi:hypothetical protein